MLPEAVILFTAWEATVKGFLLPINSCLQLLHFVNMELWLLFSVVWVINFYLLSVYYVQSVIDLANENPCWPIWHLLCLVSFNHSTVSTVTWASVFNKKMQNHNYVRCLILQQQQKQPEMSQARGMRQALLMIDKN